MVRWLREQLLAQGHPGDAGHHGRPAPAALPPRPGSDLHVLGLPLGWLLLGVLVYPLLVLLGWVYVRRAERNERHFADLMDGENR